MTNFDATFLREYRPDYQSVFSESGHDAWTLLLKRKTLIVTLLAGIAALAMAEALMGTPMRLDAPGNSPTVSPLSSLLLGSYYLAIIVVSFYALADSVRTVRSEFKMTFGGVLAVVGLSLVMGLAIDIGLLLFIIPGIWIAVKFSQTIYVYFLRPGRSALGESWNITTGHFWATLGFYFLIGLFVGFAMLLPFYVAMFAMMAYPLSAIVMIPFVFGIWSFMQYFNALLHVRWTEALLRSHEMGDELPYSTASLA